MNADYYEQSFVVQDFDIDPEGQMSLSAVLRKAQQIGTDQCTLLGIDSELYQRTHTAFLLAKLAVEFYAPMQWGDEIRIATHPSAAQRAVYHRRSDFTALDGTLLCRVDSRWVLVDTQTKRILRKPPEDMPMPFCKDPEYSLSVAIKRSETQYSDTECASYSRCDQNRHLNNTRYADIIYDALPQEVLSKYKPKRFAISYHQEVPLGATFELKYGEMQPLHYYFVGQGDHVKHFEAELTLAENF